MSKPLRWVSGFHYSVSNSSPGTAPAFAVNQLSLKNAATAPAVSAGLIEFTIVTELLLSLRCSPVRILFGINAGGVMPITQGN